MQPFPHHYSALASSAQEGTVRLTSEGVPPIESAPPAEFGGPGDQWSPEALLVAAVADCFVFTFRAVARASRFEWRSLECRAEGTLDRVDGVTRFVALQVHASLAVADPATTDRAQRLLEKAEHGCLITNSLSAPVELTTTIA